MENKRLIVYVARKFYHYGITKELGGYYVSKAYLNFAGKLHDKEVGKGSNELSVDFVNWLECLNVDEEREFKYGFHVETDKTKVQVFKDYVSCKKVVDEQNIELSTRVGTTSVSKVAKRMEFYKQAHKYGEKLEEKYIPIEERQHASEKGLNC